VGRGVDWFNRSDTALSEMQHLGIGAVTSGLLLGEDLAKHDRLRQAWDDVVRRGLNTITSEVTVETNVKPVSGLTVRAELVLPTVAAVRSPSYNGPDFPVTHVGQVRG
jgi:hypothetical protein